MKFLYKLAILLIFFTSQSCSKKEIEVSQIKENSQESEMISSYIEAMKNMNDGDYFYAAKKFLDSEILFPQSDWAAKSALMASYAYYTDNYYSEAIFNIERFIKTYPKDKRMDYAHFLLAMCFYETIVDEKKDLEPLMDAKKEFEFVISNYPNSDFALDSEFKIGLINNILASKEMYLGRHYIKKEKWIPAINRFKNVIQKNEDTIYVEEAIHRLVEIHYKIGLVEESKKYASLLGYNYLSGKWYKKSYNLFNKNYKIIKIKKEKKGMFKKFKKLFE